MVFWHFGALDGLFVELDGHYLNEDGKSGGLGEVYGCFWFNIGIQEKKYRALEENYGALDQNNVGLDELYSAVDLVFEIGEGGIG